jgi:hypothetical protein
MSKIAKLVLAVMPLALIVTACNEFKIDKRKNTPGPTGMTQPFEAPTVTAPAG